MSGASLLSATDYGQLGQFVPDLSILAGPYVYPDLAATDRLFASDLYKELSGKLEAQGIRIIMPNGLFGYRHIITNETHEIITKGGEGRIVETIPGWTHNVTNVGEDELVVLVWANEIFDRQEPDTVAQKVQQA